MSYHTSPAQTITDACIPLPRDRNGNPRYFIPAKYLPIGPGAPDAKAIGLYKYRGFSFGSGFVMQSYSLKTDIARVLGVLHEMGYRQQNVAEY